jgi:hypothetical protein
MQRNGLVDSIATRGSRCTTCHQLKIDDLIRLHDPAPDGSLTWRTAWGQSIHVPPRSYLPDPDPPPEPPTPEPEDPPPF